MLAYKVTEARVFNKPIIHKPELRPLSEIALKVVSSNFLLYRTLPNLPDQYKEKVYDLMSVDYHIEETFPVIDYEPFWRRASEAHFKSDDCSINGNSWKQCYAENYVKDLISTYNSKTKTEEDLQSLIKICQMVKYYIFNLDIPTFSCDFDISYIPQFFANLTTLNLKYSPILQEKTQVDLFSKKLEPIKEEYTEFGIRIPDLKKFCISITELSYFLSLSLQGNLVDDEMIKWLVPGLITNQTLRYLDLSSNKITGKGMIKIASYLIRTRSLLTLDLSNNLIGGESSFAVGLVIKENTRLKVLKLAMNRFDDGSGGRIVKMLAKNIYLDELDLSTNKLGKETIDNLHVALKYNNTIKRISFCNSDVEITDETKKIAGAHPNLVELNVRATKTLEDNVKQLEEVLIRKSIKIQLAKVHAHIEDNKQQKSTRTFQTKENLNNALCDQTFKSLLRGDGTSIHNENRCSYVDPKIRKRRDQTSNIFHKSEKEPSSSSDFPKPMFSARYIPSNVMFNDNYVEMNPQVRQVNKARYEVESKLKNENNHLYSDELRLCPQRTKGLERKIEENFKRNPMEILSNEQNQKMNERERQKVSKRTEAIKGYMGSEGVKKTFKSFKKDPYVGEDVNKVTKDDFDMVKRVREIHKEEPNYGKRHFRVASCGNGVFTYMY